MFPFAIPGMDEQLEANPLAAFLFAAGTEVVTLSHTSLGLQRCPAQLVDSAPVAGPISWTYLTDQISPPLSASCGS